MGDDAKRNERELRELRLEVDEQRRDIRESHDRERRQDTLITRLRDEAALHDHDAAALRNHLDAAEHELGDLRAIRDALTPPVLPQRPGLDLAAAFLPAVAENVSGDFYLAAEGPQDSTVLVVGDVVGHGLNAARRAAFVRTAFAATAPFSDDPCRLLSWANTALIERAGITHEFVTAGCVTYLPGERLLRWAYAGHPRALWLDGGQELVAPTQGHPLGIGSDLELTEGSRRPVSDAGVVLYTDGLTEARGSDRRFGIEGVQTALGGLNRPSPAEAVAILRARVADFAYGTLTDDLCLLAVRIS
jgi:sigma-B regulation protein RsbU (phosphoserine phosphatase)